MTLQHVDVQFVARLRTALTAQLPEFLPRQRWFGSKAKRIQSVHLSECVPVPLSTTLAVIVFARVEFTEGAGETYVLPLIAGAPDRVSPSDLVVVRVPVSDPTSELPLMDALGNREFLAAILNLFLKSESLPGESGELKAEPEPALSEQQISAACALSSRMLKGEQSNTSIVYGDRVILKFFRRVEEGVNPDLEIGHFLTAVAHFGNVPPLCGCLKYKSRDAKIETLGILQGFVPNHGDAWRFTVESLVELFASIDHPTGEPPLGSDRPSGAVTVTASGALGFAEQLKMVSLLAKRTAELHLALASSSADPEFAPEPFTPEVREALDSAFHDLAVRNFEMLRLKIPEFPESVVELAKQVLTLEDFALLTLHSVLERKITSVRTRIHGDYHLGQVLFTGSDFFIIDFEGEPARPLSERRNKRSPLQDVAGMLRSFHYAAQSASMAARERLARSREPGGYVAKLAAQWQALASDEFLRAYRNTAGDARFLPSSSAEFAALLRVHLLEKAVYELGYELNNRPSWLAIPLEGIREILTAKA
ncbi:MAG: putative maltokinase [Candidatus Acidiferrales bacterium]